MVERGHFGRAAVWLDLNTWTDSQKDAELDQDKKILVEMGFGREADKAEGGDWITVTHSPTDSGRMGGGRRREREKDIVRISSLNQSGAEERKGIGHNATRKSG